MICVSVFAAQFGVLVQTVLAVLVCVIALVLQLEKRPYKSELLDAFETASLICCIVTLQLGIMLVASKMGDAPYSELLAMAISVLVVLLHACYTLAWLVYFVPAARIMSIGIMKNTQNWLPSWLPSPKEAIRHFSRRAPFASRSERCRRSLPFYVRSVTVGSIIGHGHSWPCQWMAPLRIRRLISPTSGYRFSEYGYCNRNNIACSGSPIHASGALSPIRSDGPPALTKNGQPN
jgi:hypothetical protein